MIAQSQSRPGRSLMLLSLLLAVAGAASAQSTAPATSESAVAGAPVQESTQAPDPNVKAAPQKVVVNTGTPAGTGKWVPRIDKKTCPKGSEPYVDEVNGGVKCWVNTQ